MDESVKPVAGQVDGDDADDWDVEDNGPANDPEYWEALAAAEAREEEGDGGGERPEPAAS